MMARGETATAENCLSSPKNETPAGSHWFYRIDHVNKRNCWYLRQEGGGVAQALPQASPAAPAPAAKPSIADARAELRPQAAVREDTAAANPSVATSSQANATGSDASSANASVWNSPAPVATRWPDLPPVVSVPKTTVAAADAANNAPQPAAAAPTEALPAASTADFPVKPEMVPTAIAATFGALAFAGIAALVSRRFRRRVRRRAASSAQGPIWETTDDDRIVLSEYPAMDDRDYRPRFARGVPSATSRQRQRAAEYAQRAPRRAQR
jgi:hypothetical protein